MSQKLELIQIGLGNWGADWATKVLPQLEDVEVVGWVDRSAQAQAAFIERVGVAEETVFSSFAEAHAAHPDVRIVFAPVAFGAHAVVAREVLEADCHLLLEKPLTLDTDSARELIRLAAAKELVFGIDQNYRWGAGVPVVRRLLNDGAIGALSNVSVRFHRDHEGVRNDALTEMTIHHLDLMRYFFDANGTAVTCVPHTPISARDEGTDGADLIIELDSGLVVNYHLSTNGVSASTPWSGYWQISGDKGMLTWGEAVYDPKPQAPVRITHPDGSVQEIEVPEPTGLRDRAGVMRMFLDAVEGQGSPSSPAADNFHSVALLEAVLDSAAGDTKVAVVQK
jgi:predicted dehydrogenase